MYYSLSPFTPKWHWLRNSRSKCRSLMRQPVIFRAHAIGRQWPLCTFMPSDRWEEKETSSVNKDECYNPVPWRSHEEEIIPSSADIWALRMSLVDGLEPWKPRNKLLGETPFGARTMQKQRRANHHAVLRVLQATALQAKALTLMYIKAHVFFLTCQVMNS